MCFVGSTDVSSASDVCPQCDSNLLTVDLTTVSLYYLSLRIHNSLEWLLCSSISEFNLDNF